MAVHPATQNTYVSLSQESKKYLSKESRKHGIIYDGKHRKRQVKKWTNRDYHMQHNKYVNHQDVKMYCVTNHFPSLKFLRPQKKPSGLHGLGKHYNMRFDTNLGNGTYTLCRIPCAFTFCTYSLGQPWIPGFPAQQQPRCQPIKYFTHWHVLGSFNNWKILNFHIRQHPVNNLKNSSSCTIWHQ